MSVVFTVTYMGIDGEESLSGIFSTLASAQRRAQAMNRTTKERYDVRAVELDTNEWILWSVSQG